MVTASVARVPDVYRDSSNRLLGCPGWRPGTKKRIMARWHWSRRPRAPVRHLPSHDTPFFCVVEEDVEVAGRTVEFAKEQRNLATVMYRVIGSVV